MNKPQSKSKPALSFGKAIFLIIILIFGLVILFAILIYLFIWGGQQMRLPTIANIAIFVIISGIFAWVIKRITDIFAGLSRHWFPDENDQNSTE